MRRLRASCLLASTLLAASGPVRSAPAADSLYGESYRWVDDTGGRAELSSLRGRPVVVAMFYTSCTTVCSVTLGKMREVEALFRTRGIDADYVLVSFDTRFDTPPVLASFRKRHELPADRWHLWHGSTKSVRRFADRIGVGRFRDLGDHIVHSFRIVLLDEEGVPRGVLDPSHAKVASLLAVASTD